MRLFPLRVEKELDKDKWGLWRWYDIVIGGELYLSRLTLFKCPWFSVKLHWIHKADPDRDMHCHPWPFASLVLRGWYKELECKDPTVRAFCIEASEPVEADHIAPVKERLIRWFNRKDTLAAHRITEVSSRLLTLVVTGPKSKSWGFYNDKTFKFTDWEIYCNTIQKGKM